jgi:hypothetical protein
MRDESRASKQLRLKQFADRVDRYVVEQWLRKRRDSLAAARSLGLEPETIGVVIRDQMIYDQVDR